MNEEISFIIDTAKESMDAAMKHLEKAFVKIRAGKASPIMLSSVMVEYYGSQTPLGQIANVNTPDARTISVQPWEKNMLHEIEKAIMNANLGFNPMNNGDNIIINVPPLTEERRISLVKQAKSETENGKISVRNVRKEVMDSLKKLLKDGASEDAIKGAEEEVQKITDLHTKKLDDLLELKEKDIMTL